MAGRKSFQYGKSVSNQVSTNVLAWFAVACMKESDLSKKTLCLTPKEVTCMDFALPKL